MLPNPPPPPTTPPTTTHTHTPYQRLVWNYEKADPNNIRKSLDLVKWKRLFDQKSIDAQVATFTFTFCTQQVYKDDKDPVWMNETIKSKMKAKRILYKKYVQNGRFESDSIFLENFITEINELISSTKSAYYKNPL